MPILGGSPLGLIGVQSRPTRDGMSTFNGGRSRNVNVNLYNAGKEANKQRLAKAGLDTKQGAFSLFTGNNTFKAWPNIGKTGNEEKLNMGIGEPYNGVARRTLHNNDVYDTSIINLVDKLANTAAQLRPSDFAYCKNIGVLPNNRLMIARRFNGPAPDDIFGFKSRPSAVLISWKPVADDFIDITFGEEWEDAKADFTEVLNKIGEDLLKLGQSGTVMGGGLGAIPLPGWSEGLQQNLLVELGILEPSVQDKRLAVGNPNVIKQAKRRKTLGYGEAGSGLTCTCQIKMTCEYEQKFISGIDPTIAYMDILSTIVRFGTSPSADYGVSKAFREKVLKWVKNPKQMIIDLVNSITNAINNTVKKVKAILDKAISDAPEREPKDPDDKDGPDEEDEGPSEKSLARKAKEKAVGILTKIVKAIGKSLDKTVEKYTEEIKGIANALTLSPSTPWHITVGNPLRPVFSSGDMYTTSVQLSLGPNLAFNDLPSSIKCEFTLQNARAWGVQDILAKFNSGHLRTVNVVADANMLNPNQSLQQEAYYFPVGETQSVVTGSPSVATPGASTANTISGSPSTTKENASQATVNSDPNSPGPVVQNEPVQTKGTGSGSASTAQTQANEQAASQQDPATAATATSKKGYTYKIVQDGKKYYVNVTEKDGTQVFRTEKTRESDPNILISQAKAAAGDN